MHPLEAKLAASWPLNAWQDVSILLAVSGGADSVALLRAIQRLKTGGAGRLHVAHFNHGLRGGESDADQAFVRDLCSRLSLEFHSGVCETASGSLGVADEDSLRAARYRFLQSTAERLGARYVVTAHTADDQVETILHRILRGTGLLGLAGIPRTRPLGDVVMLLRPMLQVTRCEVLDYLQSLDQPFREDSSNRDTNYTRNRIRHELRPLLERNYNPNVAEAILRLGSLASDSQAVIDRLIEEKLPSIARFDSPLVVTVECIRMTATDRPVLRELFTAIWRRQNWPLAEMGFAEWDRLATIALSEAPQSHDLPGPVRAQKKGASLSLTRLE